MLNCCIQHKLAHQQKLNTQSENSISQDIHSHSITTETEGYLTPSSSFVSSQDERNSTVTKDDSGDEEFYEALEMQPFGARADSSGSLKTPGGNLDMEAQESSESVTTNENTDEERGVVSFSGRVGALKPYGGLVLIATGEQLYVPITQVGASTVICSSQNYLALKHINCVVTVQQHANMVHFDVISIGEVDILSVCLFVCHVHAGSHTHDRRHAVGTGEGAG